MLCGQPALIVTPMKNEGPYILEWVAHNMACGFDRFIVVTNDCDDQTDRILDRLEALIPLKHLPNPKMILRDRGNWHIMALRYASLSNLYKDAGWIYFTDVDEFLKIHVGAGTLQDLHDAASGFDVVSFTSMPFGSNGVAGFSDTPVVAQFTTQSKDYETGAQTGDITDSAIKTMFHNDIRFDVRRNHRPRRKDFSATGKRWVDGSGRVFSDDWTDGKAKSISPLGSTDLAQFNHYAVRSAEAFLIKVARGDAVTQTRLDIQRSLEYWHRYNRKGTPDASLADGLPEAARIRAELLSDPDLAALHAQSVAWHETKAQALRQDPEIAELVHALGLGDAAP
jgi:hypothetical protein